MMRRRCCCWIRRFRWFMICTRRWFHRLGLIDFLLLMLMMVVVMSSITHRCIRIRRWCCLIRFTEERTFQRIRYLFCRWFLYKIYSKIYKSYSLCEEIKKEREREGNTIIDFSSFQINLYIATEQQNCTLFLKSVQSQPYRSRFWKIYSQFSTRYVIFVVLLTLF